MWKRLCNNLVREKTQEMKTQSKTFVFTVDDHDEHAHSGSLLTLIK